MKGKDRRCKVRPKRLRRREAPARMKPDSTPLEPLFWTEWIFPRASPRMYIRKNWKSFRQSSPRCTVSFTGRRIPVVLAFEGWDAGGKGGAIKRLTASWIPEATRLFLRPHQMTLKKPITICGGSGIICPKAGHIAIFDRTWYGRVMVERIEGFCTKAEWQRAYKEINQMEEHLAQCRRCDH